ncbi:MULTISPECIES: methylated-DNA--[protein]-cysteine S-methyltransferase [unclassified Chelatococcus]|jgi:methylated-DNA-[protein]-cysteine S-methyltransferase|uniref:methylated-DNA--[protein]-cysteine S-methyltransferase n=1 Tax=unclassified Chelatococcus TaxID=2638111 RepID=UPI001BCBA566|nr:MULTISPECIES: methylated-DNA--[protein]-cysteine S-methyltransferase [unclassified Chelatococcus]CAH1664319.1 Methylated-DNA--protein-cysteine methyltransferase [Hyphomicrobiales bacterium]MBS7741685.1 methylated-DNA--[protein]-cysteine S-methyltransferase [Chelatococcus sp. HY11]MBX3544296.1 methylated-DNA--[protein]-cysteine S-methyltransferase [Chelatococcus sp.]MCO5079381.1 methylated-DNA--[protein]-cysteine S-methyltransferase [Chelatococcus sp.]CAH1681851.1 Methylated-DNA--protein-cys
MTRASIASTPLLLDTVETPVGGFLLLSDSQGLLHAADFADCEARLLALLRRGRGAASPEMERGAVPAALKRRLADYFAGDIRAIDSIALAPRGTDFQSVVWAALRTVPPGSTLSYAGMAEAIGRPAAMRAVGHANGANPFCIIVPCHRLTGADGGLVGYSGGLARKRWLLDHERRHATPV